MKPGRFERTPPELPNASHCFFLLNLHTFGSLGAFVWSLGGDDPLMALASSPLKDQRKLASHDINY